MLGLRCTAIEKQSILKLAWRRMEDKRGKRVDGGRFAAMESVVTHSAMQRLQTCEVEQSKYPPTPPPPGN